SPARTGEPPVPTVECQTFPLRSRARHYNVAMQIPVKQIVGLMQPDQPADVRRAAVVVLAEVGGKDGEIASGLCECLDDADAGVRLAALKAVARLKIDAALPRLLERIKDGGEEADLAAQAAARLGAKGTRSLQDLMPKVAPGLRRYIAS